MKDKLRALSFLALIGLSVALLSCSQVAEEPADEAIGPVEVELEKPEPGEMVFIPAGEFIMGTNERKSGRPALEVPEHKVDLPAYHMDVYEVTHGQWIKFLTEGDYGPEGNWRQFYSIGKEDYPVSNVTWDDAKAYCEWAGKRLPTEAEWEKAGRGSEGYKYPWGDQWDYTKTNCNEKGYFNTVEVGEIETDKSPYGVHDMMGNVQEWNADKFRPYPRSPARGDSAFTRGYIASRGGSYAMKGGSMTLYTRSAWLPKSQYGIGFRCAKDAEEETPQAEGQQ